MVKVVAALIKSGEKFLICKRPKNKARGLLWEFAGGKVEKGESDEDALIRECKEELKITVKVREKFASVIYEYPDITVDLTVYNAEITKGKPQKTEHSEIKWIKPQEIKNYTFCPADKDILEKIQAEYSK